MEISSDPEPERGRRISLHKYRVRSATAKQFVGMMDRARQDIPHRLMRRHDLEGMMYGKAKDAQHLIGKLVMLACMDGHYSEPAAPTQLPNHGRQLDGLRTSAEAHYHQGFTTQNDAAPLAVGVLSSARGNSSGAARRAHRLLARVSAFRGSNSKSWIAACRGSRSFLCDLLAQLLRLGKGDCSAIVSPDVERHPEQTSEPQHASHSVSKSETSPRQCAPAARLSRSRNDHARAPRGARHLHRRPACAASSASSN
jgi:hypothetical protein